MSLEDNQCDVQNIFQGLNFSKSGPNALGPDFEFCNGDQIWSAMGTKWGPSAAETGTWKLMGPYWGPKNSLRSPWGPI